MDTLPNDMLLHLFSFLETEDLNTMQLVRQQYCHLIGVHGGTLYSSRSLDLELDLRPTECTVKVLYSKLSLKLHFDAMQCTKTEIYSEEDTDKQEHPLDRESLADEDFLNQTIDNCLERLLHRSAGIGRLLLDDDNSLKSPFYIRFEELIRSARKLKLCLNDTQIPIEEAYRSIFTPRRSLTIFANNHHPLLDDRFFGEAGAGNLEIFNEGFPSRAITAEQLEIVLGRDDLSDVHVSRVRGPAGSCECLKRTVQRFLHFSDKSADVTFLDIPWPDGREMLTQICGFVGEEKKHVENGPHDVETVFTFKHNERVVTAKMYKWSVVYVEVKC